MSYEPFRNDRATPIRGGAAIGGVLPEALDEGTRALWIGTGGTLVVTCDDGSQLTFQNLSDGVLLPIHAASIDVGTTCTDMLALR